MKQSTKMNILQIAIALVIVMIGLGLILLFNNLTKDSEKFLVSHTRRTISQTTNNKTIITTTKSIETSTTMSINTSKKTTTTKKTTIKTTANIIPTTTKVIDISNKTTTTTTTTKKTTTTTVPTTTRNVTSSATSYPNALDKWEWAIVNAINTARKKNNLKTLSVDADMRKKAEEAADKWQNMSNDELKKYLDGYSNYASWQTLLDPNTGYNVFISETLSKTKIATKSGIEYVGVGVIYKEIGYNDAPTYYYVLIYE